MSPQPIAMTSSPDLATQTGSEATSLVESAMGGDAAAFDRLLAQQLDRTYRTARAILGSDPDARDAVQEAWLSVWRQLPRLRDPRAFGPWVDRIVVNTCRSALRKQHGVRTIPIPDSFDATSPESGPEQVAERDELERAFERLDADKRAILVLHHLHHQPVDAIAALLGIPVGTVKWRLHAARAALGKSMERDR